MTDFAKTFPKIAALDSHRTRCGKPNCRCARAGCIRRTTYGGGKRQRTPALRAATDVRQCAPSSRRGKQNGAPSGWRSPWRCGSWRNTRAGSPTTKPRYERKDGGGERAATVIEDAGNQPGRGRRRAAPLARRHMEWAVERVAADARLGRAAAGRLRPARRARRPGHVARAHPLRPRRFRAHRREHPRASTNWRRPTSTGTTSRPR